MVTEKIKVKKQQEGYKEPPRPLSAIEDFCERFDKAVRNNLDSPNKCGKVSFNLLKSWSTSTI